MARQSGFLSTLSLRRATENSLSTLYNVAISIHALLAESDNAHGNTSFIQTISIHALLAESDLSLSISVLWTVVFLSTLSLRRATWLRVLEVTRNAHFYPRSPCGERPLTDDVSTGGKIHFYPRSPCGERPKKTLIAGRITSISIHALLAESDYLDAWKSCYVCGISIHALLAESDNVVVHSAHPHKSFLSTLSLRRATVMPFFCDFPAQFLSTLSLRRATSYFILKIKSIKISIHALLAESDCFSVPYWFKVTISIHALLAESDIAFLFYNSICHKFLSTLSLRRATRMNWLRIAGVEDISIHALLAESDAGLQGGIHIAVRFLSTLSLRRATEREFQHLANLGHFYPRSPCGERHRTVCGLHSDYVYFYPRSPCGERLAKQCRSISNVIFLSTLSLRRATGEGE